MTVAIPLTRKTRNHLNSMYFGALAMGAESSIAVLVAFEIQDSKKKIDFIFKEFNIRFLKRAEAEVYFICEQVAELKQLVQRASQVSERIEQKFSGYAVVPSKNETEHIIEYDLVISLKNRSLKYS